MSRHASSVAQYVPLTQANETSDQANETSDRAPTLLFLVALNSFAFAYCLVVSTLGIVSQPALSHPALCGRRAARVQTLTSRVHALPRSSCLRRRRSSTRTDIR